ncbi:MAG: hypothetical protein ABL999_16220 [Pyrinomonadaceae bacterium]
MSKRIIAKICEFVISVFAASLLFGGCAFVSSNGEAKRAVSSYDEPTVKGQIRSADITESSGLAASKCQKNVLWTHNDSGDGAFLYAIDDSGESLGTWKVPNVENIDWEDIATFKDGGGKCYLYIGEIGDNKTKRPDHAVYRVIEPDVGPATSTSSRKEPLTTTDAESLQFSYPDFIQDAETLMVHPLSGDIYVVTKRVSGPAGVYRLKADFGNSAIQKAERVGELSVPAIPNGFLTGGDISPDGRRMIICDYTQAYEYVMPAGEKYFEKIWKQDAEAIDLGKRKGGESVCYGLDGSSIFATSEGRESPVIQVKRRSAK